MDGLGMRLLGLAWELRRVGWRLVRLRAQGRACALAQALVLMARRWARAWMWVLAQWWARVLRLDCWRLARLRGRMLGRALPVWALARARLARVQPARRWARGLLGVGILCCGGWWVLGGICAL